MAVQGSIHPTASVDPTARVGRGCRLGAGVRVGADAVVGDGATVLDRTLVGAGSRIDEDAFLGPGCLVTSQGGQAVVGRGATLGAGASVMGGRTVGRYAMVAAGSVAADDVPDYALAVGVPAKRAAWVGRHGARLEAADRDGVRRCPVSGWRYALAEGAMRCLDWPEDRPVPTAEAKAA